MTRERPAHLGPVVRLAPEYMRATGFSRERANEVLCLFAGEKSLYDIDELQAAQVESYMRSVIDQCRNGGRQ